MTGPPIEKGSS